MNQHLFDAHYFETGCGPIPYSRHPEWLNLFNHIAQTISERIQPATVLDAGCALGLLVEALRARQITAYGIDISDYAIQNVAEHIQPFCRQGSVTQPFGQRYDLIVCIEVLEHLPRPESEQAVANLCQHADDILFSSSPDDYGEATHFNVQPAEYWVEQFARHGLVRDVDFDASFISPQAIRFRRLRDPWPRALRDYERALTLARKESQQVRAQNVALRQQLKASFATPSAPPPTASPVQPLALSSPASGRVVVVSQDVVGVSMAGPGIRYFHLARVLSQHFPVTLAVPAESAELPAAPFEYSRYAQLTWEALEPVVAGARVVIASNGLATALSPLMGRVPVALDGYDPILAEHLAFNQYQSPEAAWDDWRFVHHFLSPQYHLADFFFCASERQRDWWLGLLEATGRINPATVQADPSLRQLVDVVPFGLPSTPPQRSRPIIKGVWPGIAADDLMVVWGGGLWPWLDPLTAIRAVAQLVPEFPTLRLVFPGTRHPNPGVAQGVPTHNQAALELALELNLLGQHVFFGDWIPYSDWGAVLLESDVALSLHFETFETRLAFRSRVLEYIWAGVPMVVSAGDATSDLISHYHLGAVVPVGDAEAVAAGLRHWLAHRPDPATFEAARTSLTWERAAAPLVGFCQRAQLAADSNHRPLQPVPNPQQAEIQALHAEKNTLHAEKTALQQELHRVRADLQVYENGRIARALRGLDGLLRRVGLTLVKKP